MRDLTLALPPSSFVPFEVARLDKPTALWSAGECDADRLVADFAFTIPSATGTSQRDGAERRTFLAERYGGSGMTHNGGGVRCGLHGGLQVKGIGRNPLRGHGSDFWYSHGGMLLEEAIREAVWAEVCAAVLPCGAARVHGIIATGMRVASGRSGEAADAPGALLVREAILRPAHFMRAVHFRPDAAAMAGQPNDTERTRSAIAALPQGLGVAAEANALNEALLETTARFARQLAAARIKRIVHGALTCSNIGIEGQFVDFGTITSVSDYGKVIVARGFPHMMVDHLSLATTLADLCFHARKYLPSAVVKALLSPDDLANRFHVEFHQACALGFLGLTGIPTSLLMQADPAARDAMLRSVDELVSQGSREPFKLTEMPPDMSLAPLNKVMRRAAFLDDGALDAGLADLIAHDAMRARFAAALAALRAGAFGASRCSGRGFARTFACLNACRMNADLPELYRPQLVRSISAVIAQGAEAVSVSALIADLAQRARQLHGCTPDGSFSMRHGEGPLVEVDAEAGCLRAGERWPLDATIDALADLSLNASEILCLRSADEQLPAIA